MSRHKLYLGAEWEPEKGTRFRVWAPAAQQVEVALHDGPAMRFERLERDEEADAFSATVAGAAPGSQYSFRLDGQGLFPDPYSRLQPEGVHGPSEVVDPTAYEWHDARWRGIARDDLIIYECHVGTYTAAGTFESLIAELPALLDLGVTALELMPVAEFAGRRNWGYDGVDLYAPTVNYGGPTGLKRLVDAAHQLGLGVILDVVYNHLGPSGNYLRAYAPQYFTRHHQTPWGDALNYDGEGSRWVRHYVVDNARYWIAEYHLDGLRLDATHAIVDEGPRHILTEIAEAARAAAGIERDVVVIAEDATNDIAHIRPIESGGRGLDGVWADDFHHALRSYLTREHDGYFADYRGRLGDVAMAIKQGFVYQGQHSRYLRRRRGTKTTDESPRRFVFCVQNHDQVGNRAFGDRLNHAVDRGQYLVAAAVLLLAPETPLLFMGQEFAASTPFRYFTDHEPYLGRLVTEGRRAEFRRFRAFADAKLRQQIPDPQAESTFVSSKLDLSEREANLAVLRCYRDLIHLRRDDAVLRRPDRDNLRAFAIDNEILVVDRWHSGAHRVLIANFGEARGLQLRRLLQAQGPREPTALQAAEFTHKPAGLPAFTLSKLSLLWSSASGDYWHVEPKQAQLKLAEGTIWLPAATAVVLARSRP